MGRGLGFVTVALVCVIGMGVALAPVSTAAPMREEAMGQHRAGKYYLKVVCPSNLANHRFTERLWRGRNRVTTKEVKRRLPEFRRESRRLGVADQTFARRLYHPPAPWPDNVDGLVEAMAKYEIRQAAIRLNQGSVATAQKWLRLNGRANNMYYGNWGLKIRTRLDLPPAPEHTTHCP